MIGRTAALAGLLALTAPLAACGAADDPDTLRVLAAASLTDAFTELGERFEADHEGVDVQLSFGSSTDLAQQAADGAPGAVLATADETAMTIARDADVANPPEAFAGNELILVTPAGNPAGVTSPDDLAGVTWVRCADEAPCGRAAADLLRHLGLGAEPDSFEDDARTTLDKVVAGEADAAIVYRTDALAAGSEVTTVELPDAGAFPASYSIATLEQAPDGALAEEFVDLVLGDAGRAVLTDAGFDVP